MVLSWALRTSSADSSADPHAQEMRKRAVLLLLDLYEKKTQIIIPTIVLSEFLYPIPPDEHGKFIATLQKKCFLAPFDLAACSLASKLLQQHRGLPRDQQIQRIVLKSDVMIVAAAKVAGASVFYSHDEKCRILAGTANMIAKDLPTHSEDLFKNLLLKENRAIKLSDSGEPEIEDETEE
jgi:predicted nucleic acid-binding protein